MFFDVFYLTFFDVSGEIRSKDNFKPVAIDTRLSVFFFFELILILI